MKRDITYYTNAANYTVKFADYQGNVYSGQVLAHSVSEAIEAHQNWAEEYREDARELEIQCVLDESGGVVWPSPYVPA